MIPMKQSRTPRSSGSGKPGQKNFRRMKRRLQLRVREDIPDVQQDHDLYEEEPLASVPPDRDNHAEDEDAEVMHADEDVHEDAEAPHADDAGGNANGEAENIGKKANQSIHFNRSSPMKIVRLCKDMTVDQQLLVTKADFGDMLRMKCSKLNPELCRFLMGCFNPSTCVLDFGDRGRIPVTVESVVKVMGVPMGTFPVPYHQDVDATSLILEMFAINSGGQPTMRRVETELGPTYPADQAYLRKFVIYMMSSVFAPTTGIKVSPKCYPSVINTEAIRRLNWARFIIDILIQTAKAKGSKNWFKACMPYLMILYVDSLETNAIQVPPDGTRSSIWTNQMVKQIVELDTNSDGTFGKLPLKACFRDKISLFSSDISIVDTFIQQHIQGNHDEETLSKYRAPIIEMCTVFEDGLGKFLKSISDKDVKITRPEHGQEEGDQYENKPKRRRMRRRANWDAQAGILEEQANPGATIGEQQQMQQNESKKRKQSGEDLVDVEARKLKPTDPPEEMQDVKTQESADQATCGQMASHNKQVPIITTELVPDSSNSPAICNLAGPSIACGTERNLQVEEVVVNERAPKSSIDPLELLQCYASGSQASPDTTAQCALAGKQSGAPAHPAASSGNQCATVKSSEKIKRSVSFADDVNDSSVMIAKIGRNNASESTCSASKRSFSFVDREQNDTPQDSPSGTRRITRSMSPLKSAAPLKSSAPLESAAPSYKGSPRRSTRLASVEARTLVNNSMSRKLEQDFGSAQCETETIEQSSRRELIADCPSIELGFDGTDLEGAKCAIVEEEVLVVSSNEDSGDSLDKIYANIEMPTSAPESEKCHTVQHVAVSPKNPNSYTPVPQAHKKRVVKPTNAQMSPYTNVDNKAVVGKFITDVYTRICQYSAKSEDVLKDEKIIDYGKFYVELWDLADSIRPGAWLSNSVCEVALHVLAQEMIPQKKHVMPLRMATKLRNALCIHDRVVKKTFKWSPENRLDHSEQIMFPVLQNLSPNTKVFTGHYYLINLNLKAERFEIMDSLRKEGNKGLMDDAHAIIGSIKHLWELNYSQSKINISNYRTVHIQTPMQKTTFDCGYCMLKYIELWDGRRTITLNTADMTNIRKLFMKKWLYWEDNEITWQELLF